MRGWWRRLLSGIVQKYERRCEAREARLHAEVDEIWSGRK